MPSEMAPGKMPNVADNAKKNFGTATKDPK